MGILKRWEDVAYIKCYKCGWTMTKDELANSNYNIDDFKVCPECGKKL